MIKDLSLERNLRDVRPDDPGHAACERESRREDEEGSQPADRASCADSQHADGYGRAARQHDDQHGNADGPSKGSGRRLHHRCEGRPPFEDHQEERNRVDGGDQDRPLLADHAPERTGQCVMADKRETYAGLLSREMVGKMLTFRDLHDPEVTRTGRVYSIVHEGSYVGVFLDTETSVVLADPEDLGSVS